MPQYKPSLYVIINPDPFPSPRDASIYFMELLFVMQLTAEGEQQCYEIGQQLRTRYIEYGNSSSVTTKILGLSEFYDPDRFQVMALTWLVMREEDITC